MATCSFCGAEVADGTAICPYCNAAMPFEVTPVEAESVQPQQSSYQQSSYQQPGYQQPGYQSPQPMGVPANTAVNDSGSIGWGILGFFFPLVGLILFLVWKNTKPKCAKVAGMGALIGFCLNLVFSFSGMLIH